MKKPNKSEMRKWEVESAMSTLQRAEEIRKDASLMRDVKSAAKKQAAQLMKLGGPVKKTVTRKRATPKKTITRKRK